MTKINPQPEPNLIEELGFTRETFTVFLVDSGFLEKGDSILNWEINDRDFLELDVEKKSEKAIIGPTPRG